MSPRAALAAIWREIVTPSARDEGPFPAFLLGIAHCVAGAAACEVAAGAGIGLAALRGALPLIYWLVKERGDLRRGGSVRDGMIDTAFVASGLLAAWPFYHAGLLAAALAAAVWLRPRAA